MAHCQGDLYIMLPGHGTLQAVHQVTLPWHIVKATCTSSYPAMAHCQGNLHIMLPCHGTLSRQPAHHVTWPWHIVKATCTSSYPGMAHCESNLYIMLSGHGTGNLYIKLPCHGTLSRQPAHHVTWPWHIVKATCTSSHPAMAHCGSNLYIKLPWP